MEAADKIALVLAKYDLLLASPPLADMGASGAFFVNVIVSKNSQGYRHPNHKTLSEIRNLLMAAHITPKFILYNPAIDQTEENLRASLIATYPDYIRNVFLSESGGVLNAWLDTKHDLSVSDLEDIKLHVATYGKALRARRIETILISERPVPTNTEVLVMIRKHAPINCEKLMASLIGKGFEVPSLDWVNRRFDLLRKAGYVVRIADRSYALTLDGLHRLGTAKGRRSADVGRLLALARSGH